MARGLGFTFRPLCVAMAAMGYYSLHRIPGAEFTYIKSIDRMVVFPPA